MFMLWNNNSTWIILVSKKHELTWWFGIVLSLAWFRVQTLENPN